MIRLDCCVVEGIPAGHQIAPGGLSSAFMRRRAPGGLPWSTPRKEADEPEFLGGLVGDITCGAPLAAVIRNTNTRSPPTTTLFVEFRAQAMRTMWPR